MTNPDEVLADLERERESRLRRFNSEYTQLVMEMVFAERRRQVGLGREGKIPHACEAPETDWGYRIGVLGEEFGEVCKEHIEGNGNIDNEAMLKECVQTAAVAIACAEGICSAAGMDSEDLLQPENGSVFAMDEPSPHMKVLLRANRMYESKNRQYSDVWREYGWRGCLTHLRTCVTRSWRQLWDAEPGGVQKVDNLIDAINYAAFTIRNIETGNRDGTWYE